MIYYTYKELQKALKEAGLPFSRTYLSILEKEGILTRPVNVVKFHTDNTGISTQDVRLFTEEDIQKNVEEVKKHQNKN